MRTQVLVAALMVLLSGSFRFCPSCAMAEEQQAASSAHACCEKAANSAAMPDQEERGVPEENAPERSSPEQEEDCARASVGAILQAASLDLQPDLRSADAIPAPLSAFVHVATAVAATIPEAIPIDTSPPLTLEIPIRI